MIYRLHNWKCRSDPTQERSVVVKMIKERKEALSEVETLTRFWHPNVVNFIEIFARNDSFGVVMQAMEMDIRAFMENERYFMPTIAEISLQSARGLNHIHELGTLHADIKPENIGVSITRIDCCCLNVHVRLLDFGSAKLISQIKNGDIIRSTLSYQSPEKHMGIFHYPGDIYELGLVFNELFDHRSEAVVVLHVSSSDDAYKSLISEMTNSESTLRPTSIQLLTRFQDPYHDLGERLQLISSNYYRTSDDLIQLNYELMDFIECRDPLDFLTRDFTSRIEFISHNASNVNIRVLEWNLFLLFKTTQKSLNDIDRLSVVLSLIHRFHEPSNASWLTKLLFCMTIGVICKCIIYSILLDESITKTLCTYSNIPACEISIRNTLSALIFPSHAVDFFNQCSSMPEWGVKRMDFNTFLDDN